MLRIFKQETGFKKNNKQSLIVLNDANLVILNIYRQRDINAKHSFIDKYLLLSCA